MATKEEIQADYKERVNKLIEYLKEIKLSLLAVEKIDADGFIIKDVVIKDLKEYKPSKEE